MHQPVGHVEDVVRCNTKPQDRRVLALSAEGHHAPEVGVDLLLRAKRRLRPAMKRRVDLLHGEVGALDDAQPRRRAATVDAVAGPGDERLLHCERVRQVGLQHDARGRGLKLRRVQDAAKERHGEVQVAVLLHVEVDERGRGLGARRAEEPGEAVGQHVERGVPGQEVDLRADRGHLHRHAGDVGAGDVLQDDVEPTGGLGLADDGLAEVVEVRARAAGDQRGEALGQGRRLAGQHDLAGLADDLGADGRDALVGQVGAQRAEEAKQRAVAQAEIAGHAVGREEVLQHRGDAADVAAAKDAVGERGREGAAGVVADHARDAIGVAPLGRAAAEDREALDARREGEALRLDVHVRGRAPAERGQLRSRLGEERVPGSAHTALSCQTTTLRTAAKLTHAR
jgi:hypothetical protein